jgi:hypothetical protein
MEAFLLSRTGVDARVPLAGVSTEGGAVRR